MLFGLVFTSLAFVVVLRRLDVADIRLAAVWPVVVLVVGVAIIANALLRRGLRTAATAPAAKEDVDLSDFGPEDVDLED